MSYMYCHQGIEKMTHIARSNIYWPGIDMDIADYVRYCTICAKHKASQAVQPMLPHDIPDGPWQELATDYFTHYGKEYLLIALTHLANIHLFLRFIPRPHTVLPITYKTFSPNMALLDAFTLTMDLHFPQNLSPIFSHLFALTT